MGSEHDKNEGVSLEAVNMFQARWRALFTKWAALLWSASMVNLMGLRIKPLGKSEDISKGSLTEEGRPT